MLATLSIDKIYENEKKTLVFRLLSFGGQKSKSDVMRNVFFFKKKEELRRFIYP